MVKIIMLIELVMIMVMVMMTLVVMVHSAKWANVSKPGFLSTFLPCNFSTGLGMAPETNNNILLLSYILPFFLSKKSVFCFSAYADVGRHVRLSDRFRERRQVIEYSK